MSKTSKAAARVKCLTAWMVENKIPKVKLTTTNIKTNYGKQAERSFR